jgi:ferrous iron transport protein B
MAELHQVGIRPSSGRARSDLLLVGHPNVGKSVLFSRLTGVRTIASNYPGTTVGFARGRMRFAEHDYTVVDAPGTYSLEPLDAAARAAVDLLDDAARLVNVVDATHLERHLPLTLELLAQGKPMVVALNMSDEARRRGIEIDAAALSRMLGVPVVPTVARTGEGARDLVAAALALPPNGARGAEALDGHPGHHPHLPHHRPGTRVEGHEHLPEERVWARVGEIVEAVQTLRHHHPTLGQRLEHASVHPVWGGALALLVLVASVLAITVIGELLVSGGVGLPGHPLVQLPFGTEAFFDAAWRPAVESLATRLAPGGFWQRLLVGDLVLGHVDFEQSFGLLSTGLFVPLGIVLPYVLAFYFVLALLEDTGYLPRLAVFLDGLMHRVGLHGYAIIPNLLGLGCNVPGIMATRILETPRQRFVTATLISIAVPCAGLQAMILGLVGQRGLGAALLVYGVLFLVWLAVGLALRLFSRGDRPELLLEIPPYRAPSPRALGSKLWLRVSGFLREGLPIVLLSVAVVNLLSQLGLFSGLASLAAPLVEHVWGLPEEAVVPLAMGILRKDVAVGMLAPLALTTKQLVTGTLVLATFFPCLATFVMLFRELGWKDGVRSLGVMLVAAALVGGAVNLLWP